MIESDVAREPLDLGLEFLALNDYLYGGGDRAGAVLRLVGLAARVVPGCDWAGITAWPLNKRPYSLAVSDEAATLVDQLQYDLGEGPCLAAAAADWPVVQLGDVADDARWPGFGARVQADTPIRGVLSFHLTDQPHRTALNLYSSEAGAFDDGAVASAVGFVAHARVLLMHAASVDKVADLGRALTASRQIGAAVGILMNVYKVTSDEAFDMLRRSSQHLHRKLRDVAADVTETGALPAPR